MNPRWRTSDGEKEKPTLRRSQCVTTFGIGAIVDLPEASVMLCDLHEWTDTVCKKIYDERLQKKLGMRCFRMPPDTVESPDGIPAVRFPRWMRCRKCDVIKDIDIWEKDADGTRRRDFHEQPYCNTCNLNLIPSRFVVACRKGHIDDFPYIEWAHFGQPCADPLMEYSEIGGTSALSGIYIKCRKCKKGRSMAGAFSKKMVSASCKCKGTSPWLDKWTAGCGEEITTLQRGGTDVHFPIMISSILIPPYTSEDIKAVVRSSHGWELFESHSFADGKDQAGIIEYVAASIAGEIKKDKNEVMEAIKELQGMTISDTPQEKPEEDYRYEEYQAFLGKARLTEKDKKNFLIEQQDGSAYGIPALRNVVLVKRLREVRVLRGFTRITAQGGGEEANESDMDQIEPVMLPSDRTIKWLPGYEVRGEGIFLDFDAGQLEKWAKTAQVTKQLDPLMDRFKRNQDAFSVIPVLTPEFILLHTLSHLLIRQLSFECGYSSSSLRERIYCSSPGKKPMAGILIYTAEGGADGTLGGLVRQGKADLLPRTFYEAVERARWCSSDPICIESKGQGYRAMNLGACHACSLLPETSCETLNRYLDRSSIIGTIDHPEMGFFTEWVEAISSGENR